MHSSVRSYGKYKEVSIKLDSHTWESGFLDKEERKELAEQLRELANELTDGDEGE
jgi:hypothetical protein